MAVVTRRRQRGGADLARHTIGNATVVYRVGQLSDQARTLALTVAEDRENSLVVVDLPAESPVSVWESVAEVLPRRRGGVRLVIGGRSRETTALAGQLLSERLGRSVIAPDGTVIPGAGGSLIVHSGRGSGWVRFRRGRAPRWEAKRFPKPPWDADVPTDISPTSELAVAEPIPGGVWIRAVGHDARQQWHRVRLTECVPLRNDVLTVVLGCPGSPPLRLDDVAGMFLRIPAATRGKVRFVRYGPMRVPAGHTFGQALADLVGTEVTCYTGLPWGSSGTADVRTVQPDGSLGWRPFATELAYQPSQGDAPAPPPVVRGYRGPLDGLVELAPRVYWHGPDEVVEVTRSGLLVRAAAENANTEAVRAANGDAGSNVLLFDPTEESTPGRMRFLAEDLLGKLDQATRSATRLLPVAAFLAEQGSARTEVILPPVRTTGDEPDGQPTPEAAAPQEPEQVPDAEREQVPDAEREQVPDAEREQVPDAERVEPVAVAPPGPSDTERAEPAMVPAPASVAGLAPVPPPVALAGVAVSEPPGMAPAAARFRLASGPARGDQAAPDPAEQAPDPAEPAADEDQDEAAVPEVRAAPTPSPEAAALLPDHGLEQERTWLRNSLGGQFGTMSNAVARVLSQNPGFQGALSRSSLEVLTDAVAVQLYLSPQGSAIDDGLRGALVGPHVPIARCVVSGLSRLPSHRGPSVFAATVTEAQREFYRDRQIVTEWGFLNALTAPCADQMGDTDIVIWSMTARRTKLLEPQQADVVDRVLFVPGTSFKVLEIMDKDSADKDSADEDSADEGGRARILLRELGAAEIDGSGRVARNHTSLDELALTTLRRQSENWAKATPRRRVGPVSSARFGTLPGLAAGGMSR